MCGIAGAIGDFRPDAADAMVRCMVSALAHRGPDDSGSSSWTMNGNVVALGNTRLSILDLSAAGHQPMTESSGRYWIVFNGEIYNLPELRGMLDSERRTFRTSTDTEAILHAYHRWSEASFPLLRGMFAFALLDTEMRKLHLVRDPLGIKPLYYYASDQKLLFASEVQALLATGVVPRRINSEAVSHYLNFGWIGKVQTSISGINLLQPGQALTVDLAGKTIAWSVSTYEPPISVDADQTDSDRDENTGHIHHLLEQSVKCHLLSDVPVGLFLSGGIDSTAILHLMRAVGCDTPKTFTVVFPEEDFSERHFAMQVAQRYHSEHHELELSESDLLSQLPAALASMDQPTMDGVNTYVIAHAVHSAGVKVALSGLGSDELFAGYPSFRRAHWARMAAKVPRHIREVAARVSRTVSNAPSYEKFWDLLESDATPQSAYLISRRLFTRAEMDALLPDKTSSDLLPGLPYSGDEINDISRLELQGYMTDLLLRDTDFMSMASSLEVRVPFIDKVVVRHALRLPGRWKLDGSKPKALLLDAMRGAIPEYVWNRRKMGFVFPFDKWMRSTLRRQVEETLADSKLAHAAGLNPEALLNVWHLFLKGAVRWSKPWSLFVFLRWCERHNASV